MSGTPIGNHLRRLRFEHGEISQDALARAVGITRQTIVALEGLRYAPSLELAMKLAAVFGRSVDEVFFWSEAPPPGIFTHRNKPAIATPTVAKGKPP